MCLHISDKEGKLKYKIVFHNELFHTLEYTSRRLMLDTTCDRAWDLAQTDKTYKGDVGRGNMCSMHIHKNVLVSRMSHMC